MASNRVPLFFGCNYSSKITSCQTVGQPLTFRNSIDMGTSEPVIEGCILILSEIRLTNLLYV
jgi:hypothetical protein